MKSHEFKKEYFEQHPEQKKILRKDISFQIGRMITHARIVAGMTQGELAEKMKTKQPSIARAESGTSLPSLGFLVKMAEKMDAFLIPPRFSTVPDFFSEEYLNNMTTVSNKYNHSQNTLVCNKAIPSFETQINLVSNTGQELIPQLV